MNHSSVTRCSVHHFFLLLLCLSVLSVLLSYEHSPVHIAVAKDALHRQPEAGDGDFTESTGSDIITLGRSLTQHLPEQKIENLTSSRDKLLARLKQIEARLLKHRLGAVVLLTNDTHDSSDVISAISGSDVPVVSVKKHNSSLTEMKWSVLFNLGTDNHPESYDKVVQKVDQIQNLDEAVSNQGKWCDITHTADQVQRLEDNIMCQTVSEWRSSLDVRKNNNTQPGYLFVRSGHRSPVLVPSWDTDKLGHSKSIDGDAIAWELPGEPMNFRAGPVLRVQCLVTSLQPLRFYLHPEMTSGPYNVLTGESGFVEDTLENMLQFISETYGLGVSRSLWDTIQRTLVRYFWAVGWTLSQSHVIPSTGYDSSFQLLDADIICKSLTRCGVVQMSRLGRYTGTLLNQTLGLVKTDTEVAREVAEALDQVFSPENIQDCDEAETINCTTHSNLMYFYESRQEMAQIGNWIKVYPSKVGSIYNQLWEKIEAFGMKKRDDAHKSVMSDNNSMRRHQFLTRIEQAYSGMQHKGDEIYLTSQETEQRVALASALTGWRTGCSNDSLSYGRLDTILISPNVQLKLTSSTAYVGSVDYHTILVTLQASSACCTCEVRIGNQYSSPGPKNLTLGLGSNVISLVIIDVTNPDDQPIRTYILTLFRKQRGLPSVTSQEMKDLRICKLKQDCSLPFDYNLPCGLQDTNQQYLGYTRDSRKTCPSGYHPGHWIVLCSRCNDESTCLWGNSTWEPEGCTYHDITGSKLRACLDGKRLLFLGDSTNRGILNYLVDQVNGSLSESDKTHTTRVYSNLNNNATMFSFSYFPHFWLPANHRPTFQKVLYQLIKRSLPLENNANTVLVVGGVHWLALSHINQTLEALRRKGLENVTVVMKGLGAGFHQPVADVKFVRSSEQAMLRSKEQELLQYASKHGIKPLGTFEMTMARYKDFREGKCACHFHKVTRLDTNSNKNKIGYTVEGDINASYSQILLNQICPGIT